MPANLENSQDWKRSDFIPMWKKSNGKECSDYHAIVLITHACKEMLKILQARLEQTWAKSFQMYKLALERAEEPEIKLPTSVIPEKQNKTKQNIYFCFIDCAKAFDCVDHKELWKILKEMQIPDHITCLRINLYAVKKQQSELDLHQCCILSPCLFSLYMQSTSCKIPDRMKPNLESRLP